MRWGFSSRLARSTENSRFLMSQNRLLGMNKSYILFVLYFRQVYFLKCFVVTIMLLTWLFFARSFSCVRFLDTSACSLSKEKTLKNTTAAHTRKPRHVEFYVYWYTRHDTSLRHLSASLSFFIPKMAVLRFRRRCRMHPITTTNVR